MDLSLVTIQIITHLLLKIYILNVIDQSTFITQIVPLIHISQLYFSSLGYITVFHTNYIYR